MSVDVQLRAALQPSATACQFLHTAQNVLPKTLSPGVIQLRCARLVKPHTLSLAKIAGKGWMRNVFPSASLGQELDKIDAGQEYRLDSSVFEEVFPSVEKVEKPVGARVKGLPVPQSTLIPDDWRAAQTYYHRSKKERKQEALALQIEWAQKRALEERAIATEKRIRIKQEIKSADVVIGEKSVDEWQDDEVDDPEISAGTPNVTSGRARPKDFRSELVFTSFEDIAESLKKEAVESSRVATAQNGKRGSEDIRAPVNEKKVVLTEEEKAMLRSKKLNFAQISSKTWNPLHTLAASGQVYLAAELLKKAVDLDQLDNDGLTPLHRAVEAGRKTMVRMLLKAGANPRVLNNESATLLHYSARAGNHDISKLFLRHGVDVNAADSDGWTPLHVAVQSGRLELIKALVYGGADISIANKDGNTAFDLALAFGGCFNFYDAIKFLKKRLVYDAERRSGGDANNQQPIEP